MKLRPQARRLGRQPSPQVSEQEMQIRKGLESMRNATAREVMTPRVDVVALEVPVTLDDVALAVRRSGHSHFPVYQDDLDHLLGVLFVKDLFHPGPLGIEGIRAVGGATTKARRSSMSQSGFASPTSPLSPGPRSRSWPRCAAHDGPLQSSWTNTEVLRACSRSTIS